MAAQPSPPDWHAQRWQRHLIRFDLYPSQAQLRVQGQLQDPLAPGSFQFQAASLAVQTPQDRLQFHFHLDGYQDQSLQCSWQELAAYAQHGRFPQPIRLKPASLGALIHEHRFLSGTLFLGALATALGLAWRASKKSRVQARQARLQSLIQPDRFDPLVGACLDRFRLIRPLGRGGMANVYLAVPEETLDLAQAVAIKCIRPEQLTPDFEERFQREIGVLLQLEHPNILRIIDWGKQERLPYLVTELIQGQTLSKLIPAGGMGSQAFCDILRPLSQALSYAHHRGIVHRDLKPANVMVSDSGQVKLMDFGLARGHQFPSLTLTGKALGTPAYIAPETLSGDSLAIQHPWSDQYSLGVMLFEMLCGRRPFEHEDLTKLVSLRLQQPAPDLLGFRAELPAALAQVLARMLQRQPQERFPSIEQATQAILASLEGTSFEGRCDRPETPIEEEPTQFLG